MLVIFVESLPRNVSLNDFGGLYWTCWQKFSFLYKFHK